MQLSLMVLKINIKETRARGELDILIHNGTLTK